MRGEKRVSYNTKNHTEQGGERTVIGGELAFLSGSQFTGPKAVRQIKWTVAQAAAADTDGVIAGAVLGAAASEVTTGFAALPCPRNVSMTPSANMGTTKKVTIHGTNADRAAISEELTFNGTNAVLGAKAFASVTKLVLPIQEHTPAYQVATIAATAAASGAGDEVLTFVSAATGAGFDITVAFAAGDDSATKAAIPLRAALNANTAFAAKWTAGGTGANIAITAKQYAAQDATINLTVKTAGTPNVTLGSITVNTTAGVAEDKVNVGWGDKLGLGANLAGVYHLSTYLNNVVESTAPTFAVSATGVGEQYH